MNRHWVPRIGDVTETVRSWSPERDAGAPFDYIDLSAVNQADKEIATSTLTEPSEAPSRARQLIQTDDVLVSTVRPNLNAVAIVTPEFDGATASTGFCVLRATTTKLEPRYLYHWVRTPQFVDEMVRNATGASYPAVSDRIVKNSVLPLPPLDEQRRIAAILDKVDALRQKRKRAIFLLDSLKQSTFLEMFGDPLRGADRVPLSELVDEVQIGPFGSVLHQEDYEAGGIPLVNPMHIVSGHIRPSDDARIGIKKHAALRRYHLEEGDVVLGRRGEMGRCAQVTAVEAGYLCGTGSMFIRPKRDRLRPFFLQAFLSASATVRYLDNAAAGVTMPNLNKSVIEGIVLSAPTIADQERFERYAAAVKNTLEIASSTFALVDSLFASLQHRAFSGQL